MKMRLKMKNRSHRYNIELVEGMFTNVPKIISQYDDGYVQ